VGLSEPPQKKGNCFGVKRKSSRREEDQGQKKEGKLGRGEKTVETVGCGGQPTDRGELKQG